MILRHLQQCGHRPIVLVGGGTTKVGDPTGKDESRVLLTEEVIQNNINGITKVFEKFLTFGDDGNEAIMVNNDDWLSSLKYLDFLREYGTQFTINRMMSFESVKQRLEREAPFSFLGIQLHDSSSLRLFGTTIVDTMQFCSSVEVISGETW